VARQRDGVLRAVLPNPTRPGRRRSLPGPARSVGGVRVRHLSIAEPRPGGVPSQSRRARHPLPSGRFSHERSSTLEKRQWPGWAVAVVLLGIGIVSISLAGLSSIEPAPRAITASAFAPPPHHLSCGTLINPTPPIAPALAARSFPDPGDEAHWEAAVGAANSSCRSARQVHAVVVVVGFGIIVLGVWVLRRTTRSSSPQMQEATTVR
jgi:hypothetical protein